MAQLHETAIGKIFFENNIPRIQNALERIAVSLENRAQLDRKILEALNNLLIIADTYVDDARINQTDSEHTPNIINLLKDFFNTQLERK